MQSESLQDITSTDSKAISLALDEPYMIGPLDNKTRLEKVRKYWVKKVNKNASHKHIYTSRGLNASKRLRVGGRFVPTEQVLETLGLNPDKALTNPML